MTRLHTTTHRVQAHPRPMYLHSCWSPEDPRVLVEIAISCGREGADLRSIMLDVGALLTALVRSGQSIDAIAAAINDAGAPPGSMIEAVVETIRGEQALRNGWVEAMQGESGDDVADDDLADPPLSAQPASDDGDGVASDIGGGTAPTPQKQEMVK